MIEFGTAQRPFRPSTNGASRVEAAAPGMVERLLARHDQVAAATVVPGERGPVAYVVPVAEINSGGEEVIHRQLDEWQQIYDRLYRSSAGSRFGENFDGWISSYTRQPIALDEMREWRAATVSRVRALEPRRVLEIGVGSGLLLAHLAADCEAYWGTDLSSAAVEELRRQVAADADIADRVELRAQGADRIDGLPTGYFDTIVINSVVQLFPHQRYLSAVINRALTLLVDGGAIFLGDIRDLRAAPVLHAAVAVGRSRTTEPAVVQHLARKGENLDEELLVRPEFFTMLPAANPAVAAVDVRLKAGRYHNELSRYRYDVVLHKAPRAVVDLSENPVWRWEVDIDDVDALTSGLTGTAVRVLHIPNARVAAETAVWRALRQGNLPYARELLAGGVRGLDPEIFGEQVSSATGFACVLTLCPEHVDHFEAVLLPPGSPDATVGGTYRTPAILDQPLAMVPAAAHRADLLATRLAEWLRAHLPADAGPIDVVVVDELPTPAAH
ncbi:class I SAM-dependent methyltransferase [Solwaraspora sp. WMMD791]|uniref:class I SAM-dependent methyltransferase n=1 Tax=Solwaraspora sp. WMMD791 TaxID=3016086 RepID=UPI002499E0C4|nr:class I SAM-dependent methyltransferase [Solwaraspora sp. WMMD791]WFE26119.1 class I SAM-dependent methyltransferase [Solwaraspora sp. WMMD791]